MHKGMALLLLTVLVLAPCVIMVKSAFSSTDAGQNTWVSKASMHHARGGLGVDVVNGKIYAIGGSTSCGNWVSVGTNEEYDPATNNWTTKTSMPTPRVFVATAVYDNKIYCFGGITGLGKVPYNDQLLIQAYVWSGVNEVYDPATDKWETKAPMPSFPAAQLTANVMDGKIYLIGGTTLNGPQPLMVYDPATDTWNTTRTNSLKNSWNNAMLDAYVKTGLDAQDQYASAVVGNKIYNVPNSPTGYRTLLIYDTENESWSLGTPAPSDAANGGVAAKTTGLSAPERIYFLGAPSSNLVYDPQNDSWQSANPMASNRIDFGVANLNDKLYVVGGYTFASKAAGYVQATAINEEYTPIGYGTIEPKAHIIAPQNQMYNKTAVDLIFTLNKNVSWAGYSLDGKENITITGNTTLTELSSGEHRITVYAKDAFNNTGASETITFTIAPEPLPTIPIIIASATIVSAVGVTLIIYLKKYRANRKIKGNIKSLV
jgi:hypothetical protein